VADLTGRTLGKYRIQERLGRGGMAEVYKAYQPGLERFVAVKVMHPHLAEAADFLGRFRREAQAVAQLHHPHIVQVFDFDVEDEQHYMVMEFVQGRTLKSILDDLYARGERLPLDEVFRIFRALLDAAGYAHARGMVHRDLKPANVMLDQGGRPVLTDFGIARIIGGERLTASGVSVGTPTYMSPEQGQGASGDARSDIYALGVVLYECLAGTVPYEGESSVAVLLKHISAPIPSIRQVRPDLPPSLEAVVTRALAKSPADRYQTAQEMWAALAALSPAAEARTAMRADLPSPVARVGLANTSAPTVPLPPPTEPLTGPRLSRPMVLGGIGLLVIIAALAVGLVYPRIIGPSAAEIALAEGNAQLAAGDYQLAADAFTRALELDSQNVMALLGRARAYEDLGQVSDALGDIEAAIALAPGEAVAYDARARLQLQYGLEAEPEAILGDLDRAIALAPESASAYFWRGWAVLNFALVGGAPDPQAALADLQKSVSLDPQNGEAHFTLARALMLTHNAVDALPSANRAVELIPNSAIHRKLRAHIHFALGDFHAALDDLTAAVQSEPDPTTRAALLAERAFLSLQLNASVEAQADIAQAQNLAPASRLVEYVALLLDPSSQRPEAPQLEGARADAPDDPIWQAVIDSLLGR
jgi:tetratricopeptide (TPR) repeat protein/tRNA A-37 threonylcarbamoyl transferase component Bud32